MQRLLATAALHVVGYLLLFVPEFFSAVANTFGAHCSSHQSCPTKCHYLCNPIRCSILWMGPISSGWVTCHLQTIRSSCSLSHVPGSKCTIQSPSECSLWQIHRLQANVRCNRRLWSYYTRWAHWWQTIASPSHRSWIWIVSVCVLQQVSW